jgi:hypothetical protein
MTRERILNPAELKPLPARDPDLVCPPETTPFGNIAHGRTSPEAGEGRLGTPASLSFCSKTGQACRRCARPTSIIYIALRYVKLSFHPDNRTADTKGFNTESTEKGHREHGELAQQEWVSPTLSVFSGLRIFSGSFTPSRCDRACGTGWPRRDGASPDFPRRPDRQWCARPSGCDRGRARKGPGGRWRFPAFFRLPH